MSSAANDGLVSTSDIADIAGVTRGAVSNWRRRKEDFPPQRAGTEERPLFSLDEVNAWLQEHALATGQTLHDLASQESLDMRAWAAMNTLRGPYEMDRAVEVFLALCVERVTGEPSIDETLALGRNASVVDPLRNMISTIDPSELRHVADGILEKLARSQGRSAGEYGSVGSRTSALLGSLATSAKGGTLYDPACGVAADIISAIDGGGLPARMVGHEVNLEALRIARQRAILHGIDIELTATNVLSGDIDPTLKADVVLLEPPFGMKLQAPLLLTDPRFEFGAPPRSSADMAWIQHAIAHLTENGRAYVLLTPASLFRGGAEAKIRAELLKHGCVEAIVGLPTKMLLATQIPLALWVLRRPQQPDMSRDVLLIDASNDPKPENHVAQWLTKQSSLANIPHIALSVSDLLASGAVLTPQRWITQDEPEPSAIVAAFQAAWSGLNGALDDLQDTRMSCDPSIDASNLRIMSIRDLAELGALDMQIGRPVSRTGELPEDVKARIATAADVRNGLAEAPPLDIATYDGPAVTEPMDVLVTTMNGIRARVDETGGHVPGPGVWRLRIRDDAAVLPGYLAAVIKGDWNNKFSTGVVAPRVHLKDLEIPVMPLDAQAALQTALESLDDLRVHAAQVTNQVGAAQKALLDAARNNTALKASEPLRQGGGK